MTDPRAKRIKMARVQRVRQKDFSAKKSEPNKKIAENKELPRNIP
jgi:hypothetical protein